MIYRLLHVCNSSVAIDFAAGQLVMLAANFNALDSHCARASTVVSGLIEMSKTPEIALIISTYQRPRHLQRALWSVAAQKNVAGKMEVVVCDDGSADETKEVVETFARSVDFSVRFVTHPHVTFQLSRCRNEGARVSTAPYLLFLDGDCLLPPDHVAIQLARRRPKVTRAGTFIRLDQAASERIDEQAIRSGTFVRWAPADEMRKMRNKGRRSIVYEWLRHPTKPRLVGNNIAVWRSDYERINGFDENFEGWGWEDDDFGVRLRRAGVRLRSILAWTVIYHMWHPTHETIPATGEIGKNEKYLNRPGALVRCRNGFVKRQLSDLRWRVVGAPSAGIPSWIRSHNSASTIDSGEPEVEILVTPGPGKFTGQADCNILVALDQSPTVARLARQAHMIVTDGELPNGEVRPIFPLHQLEDALKAVA
jgi:glycosyltransferase involved in cell wall biosynthesis